MKGTGRAVGSSQNRRNITWHNPGPWGAQSNNSQRAKALSSSLKIVPFTDLFCLSAMHVRITYIVGLREKGRNMSEGLSFVCFTLKYKLHEQTEIQCRVFFKRKTKYNSLTVHIFFNLQITPLSTQRKGWPTHSCKRKRVGLQYLYYLFMMQSITGIVV